MAIVMLCLGLVSPSYAASKNSMGIANDNQELKLIPVEDTIRDPTYDSIDILIYDQALINATPCWILLAADKPRQDTVMGYIDECYAAPEEKKQMKDFMKQMWKKYPVTFNKKGNITNVAFNLANGNITLTDYEASMIDKVDLAISNYRNDKFCAGSSGDISPMWGETIHGDLIYDSCHKWGLSGDPDGYSLQSIAQSAASAPDTWPIDIPQFARDWFPELVPYWEEGVHGFNHYYNPGLVTPIGGVGFGWAPSNCQNYASQSYNYLQNGDVYNSGLRLGHASHFLTDVGNPMHTGAEYSQARNKWTHDVYETYVAENWVGGYNFKSKMDNNWVYYPGVSPSDNTGRLAVSTNKYCGTIYDAVYYRTDTFKTEPAIKSATEDCILETSKRTLGLVEYVVNAR